MKKIITLLLSLALVMSLFTGCGKEKTDETSNQPTTKPVETADPTKAPEVTEDASAKTGLAIITGIAKSKDAGEADGLAQVDSTVVAVLVGEDGKILDIKIDAAQTKVNFSVEGKLVTDLAKEYKTKQELGADYGMAKVSTIGKEWSEQADALAAYVIGKTVDEVKGIAVDEKTVPTDADLAASVTVSIGGYVAAIEKAVANAQDLGAKATDKIGLGISTNIAKSKDATAEADGLAQAYSNYTAITVNADGKITSSIVDSTQGNVNFSAAGIVTSDIASTPQTKQELKEAYGMLKVSSIGKEWYEQANGFAAYVTGKTIDEVKGIAVNESDVATDADLASSVTVRISPFVEITEKAAASAAK